jgi:succinoglycan biosynthesis protein ExoO
MDTHAHAETLQPPAQATPSPPRVSILIPLYNSEATIERAIRSALQQTLADIEVIVADDASTDHGAFLVEAMSRTDPRLRLNRLPQNRGKPHAMNIMVEAARGEWLAVLDADDAYAPERLEILINSAESSGTDMAADNLRYIDSGIAGDHSAFGRHVACGFDPASKNRILSLPDLLQTADSFADFDYGILKPVIRRDFVARHNLAYDETSRLAEDFTYLVNYLVAGGRIFLAAHPLYDWTMPFGAVSRKWTQTGAGPWRYDYRPAIEANRKLINRMTLLGEHETAAMLRRRERQYHVMVHYIAAQRLAAEGRYAKSAVTILTHPSTYGLLARRITGRIARARH